MVKTDTHALRHVAKEHDQLLIYSMRRRFRVTAIFADDAEANKYMETHADDAVIACFGPFILLARKYSGEPEVANV